MDSPRTFQMSIRCPFKLAERAGRDCPQGLDRVFFSQLWFGDPVDTALKIALAYQRARGEAPAHACIGREAGLFTA